MRSLSPSLIFVCTRTVSPTRNSGICPRASGLTFRCSTRSIAFERIFVPSSDYRSPKNNTPSSLLPGEQIGAALACARHRLLLPPLRDPLVISGKEDFRHPHAAKLGRPGVLRALQKAVAREALRIGGNPVPQHTGHQPGGDLADVRHLPPHQALLARLAEDALLEWRRDQAQEQGEHFDRQHGYSSGSNSPSGASTPILRASCCTSLTNPSGTSAPPRRRSRSCGPASSRSSINPRTVPSGSDTSKPIRSIAYISSGPSSGSSARSTRTSCPRSASA